MRLYSAFTYGNYASLVIDLNPLRRCLMGLGLFILWPMRRGIHTESPTEHQSDDCRRVSNELSSFHIGENNDKLAGIRTMGPNTLLMRVTEVVGSP